MGLLPFEKLQRTVMVRKEAPTNDKYGQRPEQRTTDELLKKSIIVLDKPPGPTSHQVSDYLKKIINVKKAGHSGTLDPAVSGVLPTAVGTATRVVQALLSSGKEYVCVMHLHAERSEEDIRAALDQFLGKIKQLPPVKSAVKRQWRFRKIYYLELIEIKEQDVLFTVGCQAGTYIRKLCHDIGEKLGCGAHMAELRRTKAGPFQEKQASTLHDVTDALHYYKEGKQDALKDILLPIEAGVQHLPKIWVLDSAIEPMCHGVSLKAPGISKVESDIQVDEMVAVLTLKGELVMIGTVTMTSKQLCTEDRGVAVKPGQVFMEPGTYPRMK